MNEMSRRELIKRAGLLGIAGVGGRFLAGCGSQQGGAGTTQTSATGGAPAASGAPIRLGFIPLTDCASLVVAKEMGFFKKHGVEVDVQKQANWLAVRDKISSGELDGAHCLFGMPFSVATGISKATGDPMRVAMLLNNNGQATTLSTKAFGGKVKYADFAGLKKATDALRASGKQPTFAMTFPGGTHDMWMHLTLAAAGIDPKSVTVKVIPPPQMVANMTAGNMDGFNVGEPWGGKAVKDNVGFTFVATQDLWQDHPEKALVVNGKFADARKSDLKKVMMAMLEASQFIDDHKNTQKVAEIIGTKAYVGATPDVIAGRLGGDYNLGGGLGMKDFKPAKSYMKFHDGGKTNFPRMSHAVWFLTQYERFGKADMPGDYKAMSEKILMQDLYREVAEEMKIAVPNDDMKPFLVKADGATPFDPGKPDVALKYYAQREQMMRKMA